MDYTNKELIDELKKRGYKVAKADRIRTASVQSSCDVSTHKLNEWSNVKAHIYANLGASLGRFLIERGAVPVIEEIGNSNFTRIHRATATIIVDNPEFDWPYDLNLK